MNAALQRFGFAAHPVAAYRYFVGDSVNSLVRRTLPKEQLNNDNIEKCKSLEQLVISDSIPLSQDKKHR